MIGQRNRANAQRGVLDPYGNYNPGGIMDTPVDDLIYIYELAADGSVLADDPPFFKGQSNYLLSASLDPATLVVSLSWTYPELSLLNLSEFQHTYVDQVILQRSLTSRATPFSQAGTGPHNANVNTYGISGSALRTGDADWTTIMDYRPSPTYETTGDPEDYDLPTEFSETVLGENIYSYRLLLLCRTIFGLTDDGLGVRKELDWNVVNIITPYKLTISQGSPNVISWGASRPSVTALSILPGNGSLVGTHVTPGWISLVWQPPVSNTTGIKHDMYKAFDGVTFVKVGDGVPSPWPDPSQPGVGEIFRYKVVVTLTDLTTVTSNVVSIDHDGTIGT